MKMYKSIAVMALSAACCLTSDVTGFAGQRCQRGPEKMVKNGGMMREMAPM